MEKTMNQEERIRRAEEIYYRRKRINESGIRVPGNSVNNNKPQISLFKKMFLQLAICTAIYIIFYLIKNTNYIFSEDVLKRTKEMLSYDINFGNIYTQVNDFISKNKDDVVEENVVQNEEKPAEENTTNTVVEGGIGGAETNEIKKDETIEEKTQMEIDAEFIKANYTLKLPVKGTVTSRYGAREATEIVSANHQGIDIGADTGTIIYAAMEGTVTLVSSEGDYRKTY